MNVWILFFGIVYPIIGLLTWIAMGGYFIAAYKLDKAKKPHAYKVWSDDRECAVWIGTFFAGPLWPLAIVVGVTYLLGHSLASRELASKDAK